MSKRAAVLKEKPKKPNTFYFQFRSERLAALKGQDHPVAIIKEEWSNLTQEQKKAGNDKFKKEMEKYNAQMEEWLKAHPEDRSKGKGKKELKEVEDAEEDEEDEKPKVDKAKGAPKAGRKGKKEEEEEAKPDKAKSKGKDEKLEATSKPKRTKK